MAEAAPETKPASSTTQATPPPSAKKRRKRWLIGSIIAGAVLVVLLIVVLLIPTLLSAGMFKGTLQSIASNQIQGQVTWDKLTLGWGQGQRIDNLRIHDSQGQVLATIAQVDAPDVSLRSILFGDLDLGTVDVVIDGATITETAPGEYDLVEAVRVPGPPRQAKPTGEPLGGLRVKVNVTGKDITLQPRNAPPLTIAVLTAQGDLSNPGQAIDAVFDVQVQRDGVPAGRAQGTAHLTSLFNAQGEVDLQQAQAQANATVNQLPWPVVAAVTGQETKIGQLVGQEISLEANIAGKLLSPSGSLRLKTSQLDVALDLTASDDALALKPDTSRARFVLSEEGWRIWAPASTAKLVKPVTIEANFNQFTLPRNSAGGFDVAALQTQIELAVSDILLQGEPNVGSIALTNTNAAITANPLSNALSITATSTAKRDDKSGDLKLQLDARQLVDAQGQLSTARMEANLNAAASDVPVIVIDQLMVMNNRLVSLMGDQLNVTATARISPGDGQTQSLASGPFEMTLRSPRLQMNVQGSLSPDALTLQAGNIAGLQINQETAPALGLEAGATISPALMQVKLEKAIIPRTADGLQIDRGQLALELVSEPLTIKPSPEAVALTTRDVKLSLTSDAIGREIRMTMGLLTQAGREEGQFTASARVSNLTAAPDADIAAQPMQIDYQLHSKQLPVALVETLMQSPDTIARWLGQTINLQAAGQLVTDRSPVRITSGQLSVAAQSSQLDLDFRAAIASGMLQSEPTSHAKLTLDKAMLAQQGMTITDDASLTLRLGQIALPLAPVDLHKLQIRGMTLRTTPIRLAGDMAKTGYGLSEMQGEVTSKALGDEIAFTLHGQAIRNGTSNSPITLKALVKQPLGETPQGRAELAIRQVATPVVDMIAQQDGLLTDVLGPAIESLDIAFFTNGPSQTDAQTTPWHLELAMDATQLKLPQLAAIITLGDKLTLDKAQPIVWTLTPKAFDRLTTPPALPATDAPAAPTAAALNPSRQPKKTNPIAQLFGKVIDDAQAAIKQDKSRQGQSASAADPLRLTEPATITINFNDLIVALTPSPLGDDESLVESSVESVEAGQEVLDLRRIRFKGNMAVGTAPFAHETSEQRVTLQKLDIAFETQPTLGQSLLLTMQGSTLAHHVAPPVTSASNTSPATQPADASTAAASAPTTQPVFEESAGVIDGRIVVDDLSLTRQGSVDWYHTRSDWQVNMTRLPSALVDQLAMQQGRLAGILGPWTDLALQGNVPGELDLTLLSPQAQIDGKLRVTDQRVLHLREDMAVKLALTPEAVAVLGLLNPQLLAMESSAAPISLTIDKESFTLPLPQPGEPVDMQAFKADLSLDLGDVILRKEGMVKDVFEVLSGFGGKFNVGQRMNVHFTPMHVNMNNGRIVTNDMWLMTSDLLMGTQATVDLNQTPAFATVYLGISGQTLKRLPGARSNIPDSTVVDVKVAAPLSEVKVDHAKLIVQLAPMFVTAYGGQDARKIMQDIERGFGILDKLSGKNTTSPLASIAWQNHPQPVQVQKETPPALPSGTDAPATTQPTGDNASLDSQQQQQQEKPRKKENPLDALRKLFD